MVNRLSLLIVKTPITRSRFKGTHINELTRFWSATNLGSDETLLINSFTSFKDAASNTLIYFEISLRIQFFSASKYWNIFQRFLSAFSNMMNPLVALITLDLQLLIPSPRTALSWLLSFFRQPIEQVDFFVLLHISSPKNRVVDEWMIRLEFAFVLIR